MATACDFDRLLTQGIPHVHEKIFLSLDFNSFIYCLEVSRAWNNLLTSESFLRKVKSVFSVEIKKELWQAPFSRNLDTIRRVLSSLKIDLNDEKYMAFYSVPLIGYPYGSHKIYSYGSPLHRAARFRNVEVIQLFLKRGADPNATSINQMYCEYKWAPLCDSSWNGYEDVVKILIVGGANPNMSDKYGSTPLHLATIRGHTDVVQLLLENGAMPDMPDKEGKTALHWAATANFGRQQVVELLLNRGAKPNMADLHGRTPLHVAAMRGHKDVVQMLLNGSAEPNIKSQPSQQGVTPLHCAVIQNRKEVVQLLINGGAEPNMADQNGRTALTLALQRGYGEIAAILRPYQPAWKRYLNQLLNILCYE